MDPLTARRTWRTVEPVHAMIYFVPEADERYGALGLRGTRMGYFASRSAALGEATAEVVVATFYNFCPDVVRSAIPEAWRLAAPDDILDARIEAASAALVRALGPETLASADMVEAADLGRRAAEAASHDVAGRPLFAAHAALPWPVEPHLVLWHAQTLLREYRGDAHVAALLTAGLDPVEALVTHAAGGEVDERVLRATRAWPETDWAAAIGRLADRGLVGADGALTPAGRAGRQEVEDRTDAASTRAYAAIGDDGCARLRELVRPWSQQIVGAGMLAPDPRRAAS